MFVVRNHLHYRCHHRPDAYFPVFFHLRMHRKTRNRLAAGIYTKPVGRAQSAPPDPTAGLKGGAPEKGKEERRGMKRWRERGREGGRGGWREKGVKERREGGRMNTPNLLRRGCAPVYCASPTVHLITADALSVSSSSVIQCYIIQVIHLYILCISRVDYSRDISHEVTKRLSCGAHFAPNFGRFTILLV